jgi:hypothetical protein
MISEKKINTKDMANFCPICKNFKSDNALEIIFHIYLLHNEIDVFI